MIKTERVAAKQFNRKCSDMNICVGALYLNWCWREILAYAIFESAASPLIADGL